jgi:hypothetical protein
LVKSEEGGVQKKKEKTGKGKRRRAKKRGRDGDSQPWATTTRGARGKR